MQTDWGGEYEKLNALFQKLGITHHVSCPHAHQQNGSGERKHRHIVEVGLALLANASMPLKFWDVAFLTATYLINLMPTKVIDKLLLQNVSSKSNLTTNPFVFSGVLAGQICVPIINTNLLIAPNNVFFSGIARVTKE
jgi:hypothetical protein